MFCILITRGRERETERERERDRETHRDRERERERERGVQGLPLHSHLKSQQFNPNHFFLASGKRLGGRLGGRLTAETVLKNVLLLKKYGIKVDIKVPIMKKNYEGYSKIAYFCKNNNIPINYSVAITKRTNGDEKPLEFGLCQEELNKFINKNDPSSKHNCKEYEKEEYLCKAVGRSMSIDVHGNVYPCNSFLYLYGNIFSNSLFDIWYNFNLIIWP